MGWFKGRTRRKTNVYGEWWEKPVVWERLRIAHELTDRKIDRVLINLDQYDKALKELRGELMRLRRGVFGLRRLQKGRWAKMALMENWIRKQQEAAVAAATNPITTELRAKMTAREQAKQDLHLKKLWAARAAAEGNGTPKSDA